MSRSIFFNRLDIPFTQVRSSFKNKNLNFQAHPHLLQIVHGNANLINRLPEHFLFQTCLTLGVTLGRSFSIQGLQPVDDALALAA